MRLIPQSSGYATQRSGNRLPAVDGAWPSGNVMIDSKKRSGGGRMVRKTALAAAALLMFCGMSLPAQADLKLCNNTDSRVGVALSYKDKDGWATEGWWTIPPQAEAPKNCMPLLKGDLIARYYYVFAVDYDKGGSWGGKSMMCTRDK